MNNPKNRRRLKDMTIKPKAPYVISKKTGIVTLTKEEKLKKCLKDHKIDQYLMNETTPSQDRKIEGHYFICHKCFVRIRARGRIITAARISKEMKRFTATVNKQMLGKGE